MMIVIHRFESAHRAGYSPIEVVSVTRGRRLVKLMVDEVATPYTTPRRLPDIKEDEKRGVSSGLG